MSFRPPNYTQVPNALLDDLLPRIETAGELKVTLAIARQSLGWHRDEAQLTLTEIQKLTGLARSTASRGIQAALERGSIFRRPVADDRFVYGLAIGSDSDAEGGSDSEPPSGSDSEPPYVRASDCRKESVKETPQAPQRGDVEVVWDHYVEVMQPRGRELDGGARALIREALKVATAVECCAAIDGCRASPFHMGQNDRGKKYNRLSQILKGKRGVRTLREQIDLFLDVAEKAGVGSVAPSVDQAKLAQAKRNVLTAWEMPGSEQARKAGEMSAAWLAQHGYTIVPGEGGRPQFHRDSE